MSTTPGHPQDDPTPGSHPPPPPGGSPKAQPPTGQPPTAYGPGTPLSASDQRTWAVVSHLGGVVGLFLVPLIVWLVFKGRGAYLEDQAKEALNFQITLAIAYAVGAITFIIIIGFFIVLAAWLATLVLGIIAAVAASRGEPYRYPVALRLVD